MWKNIKQNRAGFSLTEVLIAVMVLTVAIVASSSLLVTLIKSNDNNSKTIQAYYFAVEGLEAVRNIRDTNWLHNADWLGESSKINYQLERDQELGLILDPSALTTGAISRGNNAAADLNQVANAMPWSISVGPSKLYWVDDEETVFTRTITISEYDCATEGWCVDPSVDPDEYEDFILVESTVSWNDGEKSVTLSNVLTNWKDGVL